MKKLLVAVFLLTITNVVYAHHGEDLDVGPQGPQGPAGPSGPQGAAGPQGVAGANGKAGTTGPAGSTGANGTNGSNPSEYPWHVDLGAGLRFYDTKYFSANAFALKDVNHEGGIVGGLLMFKVGKSYEEREMEKMRSDLKTAMAKLNAAPESPAKGVIRGGSK